MNQKISYYLNGEKESEVWHKDITYHRINGPAFQSWYPGGQKHYEEWRVNGEYHRLYGPAYQSWRPNGQKYPEKWWINGINKTDEIIEWITQNNILLDDNSCIEKKSDKMLFKLMWN